MKRIYFCLISVLMISLWMLNPCFAATKIYGFKSAIIDIETTGANTQSTERIYIDDWGNIEARYIESTVSIFGMENITKQMALRQGDILYNVDLKANTAMKINIKEMQERMQGILKGKDLRAISEDMINKMGGRKVGKERFLGRDTDVYVFEDFGSKVWSWKRFPIKSETNVSGMKIITEATNIEENVAIPKDKVTLPANIKIMDAPDMGAVLKKINVSKKLGRFQEMMGDGQDMDNYSKENE